MIFKKKKYQRHFIIIFALFVYLTMVFGFVVNQVMQKSQQWEAVLESTVTVELPMDQDIQRAITTIRAIDGIKVVKEVSDQQKKQILSKWLSGVDISKMPIVNILEVTVSKNKNIKELKNNILNLVSGSKVYSNMDWGHDIFEMTQAIFYMCIFLFCLMIIISIVLINFLIQSLLNTYAKEIDIIHLNGANDAFISTMIQKNIFIQSLKASFIGVLFSNITWIALFWFFKGEYVFDYHEIITACFIILLIPIVVSIFVKFNVEKELRL